MLWQLLISFCQDDECGPTYRSAQGVPMSSDNEGSSICALDRAHQKRVYKALQEEITNSPLVLLFGAVSLSLCIEMKKPGIFLHPAE